MDVVLSRPERANRLVGAARPLVSRLAIVLTLIAALGSAALGQAWWDDDWTRRVKLVFDNSGQSEDLDFFPVLVVLNSSRVDYTLTKDLGEDLRFVDADGSTVLAHEIEDWDEDGTSEVWVRVPRIDGSSDTDFIWLYYGNTNASDIQDPATVWSSAYEAVWHLREDPSGTAPQVTDSTGNGLHGTSAGSMASGDQIEGQVDGSLDFDGSDDSVDFGDVGSNAWTGITVEAWIYDTSGGDERVLCKSTGTGISDHIFSLGIDSSFVRAWLFTDGTGGELGSYISSSFVSTSTWQYVAFTWDAATDTLRIYGDGDIIDTNSHGGDTIGDSTQNAVLANVNLTDNRYWEGQIDEARLSSRAQSTDWMKAQFLSMSDALITYTTDTTPTDDVAKLTAASGDLSVTLEWANPSGAGNGDFDGVLVLRRDSTAVTDAPTQGTLYSVGDTIGSSTVVCLTSSPDLSCTDSTVSNATIYHYKAFAVDHDRNYATGVATRGIPRSAASYKWAFTTEASSLSPVGAIASASLIGIGNDHLLHRMAESDGTRGDWESPVVGGAVQSRPMVGDLDPDEDGTTDYTAYVTAQNGYLYRFDVENDGSAEANADVATDAGCPGGILQSGPVVLLDFYDANSNTNDDVVVVATRCGDVDSDGTLNDNKILAYTHDLTLLDSYDGDETGGAGSATLGISNATPRIYYRDSANNLVYVPLNQDGDDDESLVVMSLQSDQTFSVPPYSEITGVGDVDATPIIFRFGASNNHYLIFGNDSGTVFLYDAETRVAGVGSPLNQRDTYAAADGPVKGIAVSTRIPLSPPVYEHRVVWSTDGTVHGIRVQGGSLDFDDSSYWSQSIAGPSVPLILRWVGGTENTLAYVGSSDGNLYELDATTGSVSRSWLLESGVTIGDPTFDYNDGVNQGIVVGSSSGVIHWVVLD